MSDTLKNAYQLYISKNYSEVISLLEPQIFRYRGDFKFYYFLGMSCLYQGDYGGAFSYLRRALSINEDDVDTLLGLAFVYLKRGETSEALKIWLDIIDMDPSNSYAQRGLSFLKKNTESNEFISLGSEKISRFVPQEKRKVKPRKIVILSLSLSFVLILTMFFIRSEDGLKYIRNIFIDQERRPEIFQVEFDARKDYLNLKGEYSYILTEKEVEKKIKLIQDYLYQFKDNLAQHEINLLLMSNASEYIKDRARLLEKYVKTPELASFKNNFTYAEVEKNPAAYRNCYILWKGKATNLKQTSESIKFDFLVGYQDNLVLEGIIPVNFDFSIRVVIDYPVELLAKLEVDAEGELFLSGISIGYLQPSEK